MYRNTKSQRCTPAANISVLSQFYFKNKHKLIEKEIRFVITRGGVVFTRGGELDEDSK